jgi:hypothetical protein
MQVASKEVVEKKKIGKRRGKDVWAVSTIGGLHLVADTAGVLGLASHPGLARHIARTRHPEIEFVELQKSHFDPRLFATEIEKWSRLTETLSTKV